MSQMLLVDSFANARRHERATDPPRVLLECHYDRLGGSRLIDFVLADWNLFAQQMMNKDAITKEGLGKNGYHYNFTGWLYMYRYAVSPLPQSPCLIVSVQSLTERYHGQRFLYDSDHGDRVGAGATHIFTAQELVGLEDPVVKEVPTCFMPHMY